VNVHSDELSGRARGLAVAVLACSDALEQGVVVPYGNRVGMAAVGLTMRIRHLASAAIRLTNDGSWLEAQILLRSLLEYVITLEWIAKDPDRRVLSWWRADERAFDSMVDEVGSLLGDRIGLPEADEVARRKLIEQIADEAVAAEAPPYPRLKERAKDAEESLSYSLLFRHYSQGGVHPFRQSLLPLIEDMPKRGAVLIRARPQEGPIDDPYFLTAVLVVITLERLSGLQPSLQLPSVEPIKRKLMDLKQEIDAEDAP
jgi:Family of unknown function (DUF5677)